MYILKQISKTEKNTKLEFTQLKHFLERIKERNERKEYKAGIKDGI